MMDGFLTGFLVVAVVVVFITALFISALSAASIPFNYGRKLRHPGVDPWRAAGAIGRGAGVVWIIFGLLSVLAILTAMIGL